MTVTDHHSDGHSSRSHSAWAHSWPEAMQAAYVLLRDLDRELMDEVHASRAARRLTPAPKPATAHLTLTEATA